MSATHETFGAATTNHCAHALVQRFGLNVVIGDEVDPSAASRRGPTEAPLSVERAQIVTPSTTNSAMGKLDQQELAATRTSPLIVDDSAVSAGGDVEMPLPLVSSHSSDAGVKKGGSQIDASGDDVLIPFEAWEKALTFVKTILPYTLPEGSSEDFTPELLPKLLEDLNSAYRSAHKSVIRAYFGHRGDLVMGRVSEAPPASVTRRLLDDNTIVKEMTYAAAQRWYCVIRGKNVGAIQGEEKRNDWVDGVKGNHSRTAKDESEAVAKFLRALDNDDVDIVL